MHYSEIIPGRLYAGTRIDHRGWRVLRCLGVNAIVNLIHRTDRVPDNYPPVRILNFPLGNTEKPPLEKLIAAVELTVKWLQEGRVVYVHDLGGRNRLGFFVTALLMRLCGLPFKQAFALAKQKRRQLAPRSQFIELLHDYEKTLLSAKARSAR